MNPILITPFLLVAVLASGSGVQAQPDTTRGLSDLERRMLLQSGDTVGYLRSVNERAQQHLDTNAAAEALELLEKALGSGSYRVKASSPEVGQSLFRTYLLMGRSAKWLGHSVDRLNHALQARKVLLAYPVNDSLELAMIDGEIGKTYRGVGYPHLAIPYLESEYTIKRRRWGVQDERTLKAMENLGRTYSISQQIYKSENLLLEMVDIRRSNSGTDPLELVEALSSLAACYLDRNDYPRGLKVVQEALDITIRSVGSEHYRAAFLQNYLSFIYIRTKEWKKALEHAKICERLAEDVLGITGSDLTMVYANLSLIHHRLENKDSTYFYLIRALENQQAVSGSKDKALGLCLSNVGYFELETNNHYNAALGYFQQALNRLCLNFEDTSIYRNPKLEWMLSEHFVLMTLKGKATALQRMFEEDPSDRQAMITSLQTWELALDLLDTMRRGFRNGVQQQDITQDQMSIYGSAIDAAWKLHESYPDDPVFVESAFSFSERSKAFVLLKAMQSPLLKGFPGVPDSVVIKEERLRMELSLLQKRVQTAYRQKDTAALVTGNKALLEAQVGFIDFRLWLENQYPSYTTFKYGFETPGVSQVREHLLRGDGCLLSYFWGDSAVYAMGITENDVVFKKLGRPGNMRPLIADLRQQLSPSAVFASDRKGMMDRFIKATGALYQELLEPLFSKLDMERVKRLIIVPDGNLSLVPFEVLSDPKDTLMPTFSQPLYLTKRYATRYSNSAQLLLLDQTPYYERDSGSLLALAPAVVGSGVADEKAIALSQALPASADELRNITQWFTGGFLLGEQATESNFKKLAPEFNLVHVAAHTELNDSLPLYSKIHFAVGSDTTEDDHLHAYELYQMKIPSELVVLSACESGKGKVVRGEGMMSLARAFMYAGSRSLVVSLWKVDDHATAQLMKHFYQGLAQGCTKDVALQRAKLALIDSGDPILSHPFCWGAFVLNGNSDPIHEPANRSTLGLLLGILLMLTVVGGLLYYRRKRRFRVAA